MELNQNTRNSEPSKLSCTSAKHDRLSQNAESLSTSLSDVGLYSLSGLVAVSLIQLFEDEYHRMPYGAVVMVALTLKRPVTTAADDILNMEFREKTLKKVLQELKQPKQVTDSMMAIIGGEIMNESSAFVDSLVKDECLKTSREPVIASLISLAISEGHYDARVRMLIKHIAWQLRITWELVEEIESDLAVSLEYNTYVMSEEEALEKAKKAKNRKIKRYALIGLATVGGGALIGLTGGLAAPLVAAGAGVVIGGAGAAALGSAAGVAIIGSLFGVAGAGLTGYKMKRRVGAIEEFSFEPLTLIGSRLQTDRPAKQLHITIAVTGWLNDKMPDFRMPWSALAESKEQYSLQWESKYLYQLGEAFDYILQAGLSMATTEALKYTILSGLIAAIAWPAALISAAGVIDNPWHVCTQRSEAVGKQLAEVLLAREQGNRPVTLIGFSMGARVIFYCLDELCKRKGSEGLIEDVVMLGAPVSGDPKNWMPFSKIVAGKIVNGYSRGDWLLKFLYRTANVKLNVAGLGAVKWDNRRMHNIDLTDVIDGHSDYIKNLDIIMKAVGVRTKDELKPFVPKSGSKSNIPKPESASAANSDGNDLTNRGKENANADPSGKLLVTHRNEDGERHISNKKSSVNDKNSVEEKHMSGITDKVEMSQNKSSEVTGKTEAEGKSAIKSEKLEENSEGSVDFTSSESEFSSKESTPIDGTSNNTDCLPHNSKTDAKELRDSNQNAGNLDNTNKDSKQRAGEITETKKATKVEDEIRQIMNKSEGEEDEDGCYFTDSDPEGEA